MKNVNRQLLDAEALAYCERTGLSRPSRRAQKMAMPVSLLSVFFRRFKWKLEKPADRKSVV